MELQQWQMCDRILTAVTYPISRNRPLKTALLDAGIQYVFLGKELGARPADQSCYIDGKALYEKIAATEIFSQGIQRLLKGA